MEIRKRYPPPPSYAPGVFELWYWTLSVYLQEDRYKENSLKRIKLRQYARTMLEKSKNIRFSWDNWVTPMNCARKSQCWSMTISANICFKKSLAPVKLFLECVLIVCRRLHAVKAAVLNKPHIFPLLPSLIYTTADYSPVCSCRSAPFDKNGRLGSKQKMITCASYLISA